MQRIYTGYKARLCGMETPVSANHTVMSKDVKLKDITAVGATVFDPTATNSYITRIAEASNCNGHCAAPTNIMLYSTYLMWCKE